MSKKTPNNSSKKKGNVLGRWLSRWFRGGSNQLAEEMEKSAAGMDKEELVSPGKQVLRNFLERKLAVGALCLLVIMFLTMIIGPMFMPTYSDSYTEITQKSVPPTMSMMKVPKELAKDIKMIDGFGSFTVGLSNAGKVYIWGATQIGTTGIDIADIPQEVKDAKITMIAAGIDHIVAISEEGKIYCWGNNRLGQFGTAEETLAAGGQLNPNIAYMPEELATEGVDPSHIKKFTCGYQCTAILMDDGTLYLWGNKLTYGNMDVFLNAAGLKDIDFTLNYVVGLNMKRDSVYTGTRGLYDVAKDNVSGPTQKTKDFLNGRTITSLTASSSSVCLLLSDGTLGFVGDFATNAIPVPALVNGEKFVQVVGGSYHYTGLTDQGRVYSWGSNTQGQTDVPSEATGVSRLFSGSFQSYGVDENNSLQAKWGLKGYLFGTEVHGADIFQRIINGGKMTMTIGAVAVIISAIIDRGMPLRLLWGQGGYPPYACGGNLHCHPLPALCHDSLFRHGPYELKREHENFHYHVHPGCAHLAGPGKTGPRTGSGGQGKRVRDGCQVHGRKGMAHCLQAHPSQRHVGYPGVPDAGFRHLHADGINPELPGLRRGLSPSYLGQHAQRRQQRHHYQRLLVAMAVYRHVPGSDHHLHQYCGRCPARRDGSQIQRG